MNDPADGIRMDSLLADDLPHIFASDLELENGGVATLHLCDLDLFGLVNDCLTISSTRTRTSISNSCNIRYTDPAHEWPAL